MPAAATDKLRKTKGNFSTTLSSGINSGDTSIPLASVSGLPTDTAVTLMIDRVDTDGEERLSSLWELVTGVISGGSLTSSLRGEGGTSAQAHLAGAVVEAVVDNESWNDLITHLLVEHNQDGTHSSSFVTLTGTQTLTNKTLTSPVINTPTGDVATKTGVETLTNKTLTKPTINGSVGAVTADVDGATVTFDMAASNYHTVTLGGNRTLALSNVSTGQHFILRLLQDATGSRLVTWFSTIKWAGGVAPTLTTTPSKADVFGFTCTGTNTYDGFVVGQNL